MEKVFKTLSFHVRIHLKVDEFYGARYLTSNAWLVSRRSCCLIQRSQCLGFSNWSIVLNQAFLVVFSRFLETKTISCHNISTSCGIVDPTVTYQGFVQTCSISLGSREITNPVQISRNSNYAAGVRDSSAGWCSPKGLVSMHSRFSFNEFFSQNKLIIVLLFLLFWIHTNLFSFGLDSSHQLFTP